MTGWRLPVMCLRMKLTAAGPFLLGWAVPGSRPARRPGRVHPGHDRGVVVTVISCCLGSARVGGTASMAGALYLHEVIALDRAAAPAWKPHAGSILSWITGPPHSPFAVRRALITVLARGSGDPGSGWMA